MIISNTQQIRIRTSRLDLNSLEIQDFEDEKKYCFEHEEDLVYLYEFFGYFIVNDEKFNGLHITIEACRVNNNNLEKLKKILTILYDNGVDFRASINDYISHFKCINKEIFDIFFLYGSRFTPKFFNERDLSPFDIPKLDNYF